MPSQQLIDIIIRAKDEASTVASQVDSKFNRLSGSMSRLSRVPGIEGLKAKFTSVANTVSSRLDPAIKKARSSLEQFTNKSKGLGSSLGGLKSILSVTAGMIGYDLVSGLVQSGREAINASNQLEYFSGRLNMSTTQFQSFRKELDGLQKDFKKVNMTAVGATAEEMAVKYQLPIETLGELSKTTAIVSSAFVKEGRSQEEAVLAVSDAMDGEFRRLKELGIQQDDLMSNGWNGDLQDKKSLMDALNKTLETRGFADTAKDITSMDEAWTALTVSGGILLEKILVPLTPILVGIVEALISIVDVLTPIIEGITSLIGMLPDFVKFGVAAVVIAAGLELIGAYIMTTLVPAFAAAAIAALDFAAALLANPLTWVVVALMAVAYAVYEVGKAFGWWKDVNGMLKAIWSGIQRLWSAFINNPDVVNFLRLVKVGWNSITSALKPVIDWVKKFFTVNNKGKFDIVRALIDGVSLAWKAGTAPIRLVISAVKSFGAAIGQYVSPAKSVVNGISSAFNSLKSAVESAWNAIKNAPSNVLNAVFGGGAYGGEEDVTTNASFNVSQPNMHITNDVRLTVDLANIPAGVDEEILRQALVNSITDTEVINKLVNNEQFQAVDSRVKNRIMLRNNRAKGV